MSNLLDFFIPKTMQADVEQHRRARMFMMSHVFGPVLAFLYLPPVDLNDLQIIGMISMASVAIYFSMTALYFASTLREQREFERELHNLITSSDNMRNLTDAARQARAAKSGFIAGMSHELRTPLNAIIGYGQARLAPWAASGGLSFHF